MVCAISALLYNESGPRRAAHGALTCTDTEPAAHELHCRYVQTSESPAAAGVGGAGDALLRHGRPGLRRPGRLRRLRRPGRLRRHERARLRHGTLRHDGRQRVRRVPGRRLLLNTSLRL